MNNVNNVNNGIYNTPKKNSLNNNTIYFNECYFSPDDKNTQNKKQKDLNKEHPNTIKKNIINKENVDPNEGYCYNDNQSTQKSSNIFNNQQVVNDFIVEDILFSKNNFNSFLNVFKSYNRDKSSIKLFNNNQEGFSLNHIIPIKNWINLFHLYLKQCNEKQIFNLFTFIYNFVSKEDLITDDNKINLQKQIKNILIKDDNICEGDENYKHLLYFFAYYPNNIAYAPNPHHTSKRIPDIGKSFDFFHGQLVPKELYVLLEFCSKDECKLFNEEIAEKFEKILFYNNYNGYKYNEQIFMERNSSNGKNKSVMVYKDQNQILDNIKNREVMICKIIDAIETFKNNQDNYIQTLLSNYLRVDNGMIYYPLIKKNPTGELKFDASISDKIITTIENHLKSKDIEKINVRDATFVSFNLVFKDDLSKIQEKILFLQDNLFEKNNILNSINNILNDFNKELGSTDAKIIDEYNIKNNDQINLNSLSNYDFNKNILLSKILVDLKNKLKKKDAFYKSLTNSPVKQLRYDYAFNLQGVAINLSKKFNF